MKLEFPLNVFFKNYSLNALFCGKRSSWCRRVAAIVPKPRRRLCCVCCTRNSSKFVPVSGYLRDFDACLNWSHTFHPGDKLCNICRSAVIEYRVSVRKSSENIKELSHLVGSKGPKHLKKTLTKKRKLSEKLSVGELANCRKTPLLLCSPIFSSCLLIFYIKFLSY